MIRIHTLFAAAGLAGGLASFATPVFAQAFDDRQSTFAPLIGIIGGGDDTVKSDIDFRERAPLVVPKTVDLPSPKPGVGPRVVNWPKDQDTARRREEAAAARVPQQTCRVWSRDTSSMPHRTQGEAPWHGQLYQ